jgi:CelD/BcsL family acetyltransferase involved in cellulose biosynthesis
MQGREDLKVVVVPIAIACETLREDWPNQRPDEPDDPTLTPEWLQIWWRHFGLPGTEQVLCLLASSGEKVGFLFTLTEVERHNGLPVRVIRCWVNSHNQRAALFLRCDADAAARALSRYWADHARQWDLLRLHGLPDGIFTNSLVLHASALRCECLSVRPWSHSRLRIRQSWEEYFREAVSKDTRKRIDRQGRQLAEYGALTWRSHTAGEASTIGFDAFMNVELRSWKAKVGEIVQSESTLTSFYRDVIRTFEANEKAVVTALYLHQTPICAGLSLLTDGRLLLLKTSFDEKFAKYSPGSQLYKNVIAKAFNDSLVEVDFYSKMEFSQRWTKDERHFVDLQILSSTIRSRLIGRAGRLARLWTRWRNSQAGT